MRIEKIRFGKKIGMPGYSSDNIEVEGELLLGETKEEAWSKINKDMIEWHKREYPHLYQDQPKVDFVRNKSLSGEASNVEEIDNAEYDKFLAVKTTLSEIACYEAAKNFLAKSSFKYNVELKAIVESKNKK